jgi:5-methylcytosine-specific restriction endonuclease McrA
MIEAFLPFCCAGYLVLVVLSGLSQWLAPAKPRREPIPHWMRQVVVQRDGRYCRYCGKYIRGVYHLDHVTPVAQGGVNSTKNLVVACPSCNMSKGARTPWQWRLNL